MRYHEIMTESADHTVMVFHGGKDFDQIDVKKFGTGEPGGIRPLGKGLYGGLAVTPDDVHSAIEIAKVYARKYGGKTPTIHGFEAQLPNKIKNLGYDNRGWARTGGTSWEAEALPWRPAVNSNTAKEISVVDPSLLRKIGKWPADTPTEQIERALNHLWPIL
jgi:hypothetical protein